MAFAVAKTPGVLDHVPKCVTANIVVTETGLIIVSGMNFSRADQGGALVALEVCKPRGHLRRASKTLNFC